MHSIQSEATKTLEQNRVAVFIVAYNAEKHIEDVLSRIPDWVANRLTEIFIIDDSSSDRTVEVARNIEWSGTKCPLKIFKTPYNQGYGGNQRLGFSYAIEQGFGIVVLLHGDGQYAPESLPEILAPYSDGAKIVYGSRFLTPLLALKGGMPLYKWLGNRVLTFIQNWLLSTSMSEWHSGYRSYSSDFLKRVPFKYNSRDFDFDCDIIIQAAASNHTIVEVPIPTYYGDELCNVDGLQYAWRCVKACLQYRFMQFELFYNPKFDFTDRSTDLYTTKNAETSLHYHVRAIPIKSGSSLLDVGGGSGDAASKHFAKNGVHATCIDQFPGKNESEINFLKVDLNKDWAELKGAKFNSVVALDVIEHLLNPERAAEQIYQHLEPKGKLYASTANIAFFPLRLMLFLGYFNYGRKGILDLTHTRLFTIESFRRLLTNAGFRIDSTQYFGPPLADINQGAVFRFLDKVLFRLANLFPSLFCYQMFFECTRLDSLEELLDSTLKQND